MAATAIETAPAALPDAPPLDVERFYALTADWRERAELIEGEVHVVPAPSLHDQDVAARVYDALRDWTRAGQGRGRVYFAPVDVVVIAETILQPDVMWWRAPPDLHAQPSPAPDLAVEVLSPATRRHDVERKRRLYARGGVAEVWLVDPDERKLTALREPDAARGEYAQTLGPGKAGVYATPLLPGLKLTVASLFP